MLWSKLLQNTIYCGKLQLTSYQLYRCVTVGGTVVLKQEIGGKRQKIENFVLCPLRQLSTATTLIPKIFQQAIKWEGG